MKIVFISGRASEKNPKEIDSKTKEIANTLAKKNIGVFCPQTNLSNDGNTLTASDRYWNSINLEIMRRACHAVLVVPKIELSPSEKEEIKVGKEEELPIFYPKSPNEEDLEEVINWYFDQQKYEDNSPRHIISFEEARMAREKIKKEK